jgi:hypothetical protein
MNLYAIHAADGRTVAQLYAITPGAAAIQWALACGRVFPGVTVTRDADLGDEIARYALDPAFVRYARDTYNVSPRSAFRINQHYARERVAQAHERFCEMADEARDFAAEAA